MSFNKITVPETELISMKARISRLEEALNKIAMLGCSEMAYTSEFTERVNTIVRAALCKDSDVCNEDIAKMGEK